MSDPSVAEAAPKTEADYAKDCREALGKHNNTADMAPAIAELKAMEGYNKELVDKLEACVNSSNAAEAYKVLDEAYPAEPPAAPAEPPPA